MCLRYTRTAGVLYSFLPFKIFDNSDQIDTTLKTVELSRNERNENETGMDRLRLMFSFDEFGNTSPELHSAMQTGCFGVVLGVVYGGFMSSRTAYTDFIERNQATSFYSHIDAKKKLQDSVTISFAKGAFKWGWRLGLFTTLYVLSCTALSVYRNKTSVWNYIAGGSLTGALYKFKMGPAATLVGAGLGGVLGAFSGVLTVVLMNLADTSMEEVRYWQYSWKLKHDENYHGLFKADMISKQDRLVREHDCKVGEIPPEKALSLIDSSDSKQ